MNPVETSVSANEPTSVPVVAIVSAVAFAASGALLSYSLLTSRKRSSIPGQLGLGVLVALTGILTWNKRQEEADAARHLADRVHHVRDAHWLKKHPVAYG